MRPETDNEPPSAVRLLLVWVARPAAIGGVTYFAAEHLIPKLVPPLIAHALSAPAVEAAFVIGVAYLWPVIRFPFQNPLRLFSAFINLIAGLAVAVTPFGNTFAARLQGLSYPAMLLLGHTVLIGLSAVMVGMRAEGDSRQRPTGRQASGVGMTPNSAWLGTLDDDECDELVSSQFFLVAPMVYVAARLDDQFHLSSGSALLAVLSGASTLIAIEWLFLKRLAARGRDVSELRST